MPYSFVVFLWQHVLYILIIHQFLLKTFWEELEKVSRYVLCYAEIFTILFDTCSSVLLVDICHAVAKTS